MNTLMVILLQISYILTHAPFLCKENDPPDGLDRVWKRQLLALANRIEKLFVFRHFQHFV